MLFSKGLNFSPTPFNSNNQESTKDIKKYTRKLKLAEYFYSKDTEKEKVFIAEPEQVMKSLSNDCTIVIKEADKGGAVVIMDANYYENKITQMLSNGEFYEEIPENQDRRTMQKVKNLLLQHKEISSVTDKEALFLTDFEYRGSVFYGLPKIHESKLIREAIKIQNSDYITCLS